MKILRLTNYQVTPAVAEVYKHKGKNYFNLKHGMFGSNFWRWSCGLEYKHFKPKKDEVSLTLDNDNYTIVPVKHGGELLKDGMGNVVYNIGIDHSSAYRNDILLLWNIPNKLFKDVTYTLNGMCSEIGRGSVGRTRGTVIYKSPYPVIEIVGDTTLSWTGVDNDGNQYSQTVKYSYAENLWDIQPIDSLKVPE